MIESLGIESFVRDHLTKAVARTGEALITYSCWNMDEQPKPFDRRIVVGYFSLFGNPFAYRLQTEFTEPVTSLLPEVIQNLEPTQEMIAQEELIRQKDPLGSRILALKDECLSLCEISLYPFSILDITIGKNLREQKVSFLHPIQIPSTEAWRMTRVQALSNLKTQTPRDIQ